MVTVTQVDISTVLTTYASKVGISSLSTNIKTLSDLRPGE